VLYYLFHFLYAGRPAYILEQFWLTRDNEDLQRTNGTIKLARGAISSTWKALDDSLKEGFRAAGVMVSSASASRSSHLIVPHVGSSDCFGRSGAYRHSLCASSFSNARPPLGKFDLQPNKRVHCNIISCLCIRSQPKLSERCLGETGIQAHHLDVRPYSLAEPCTIDLSGCIT
jgi:hypothetical protein